MSKTYVAGHRGLVGAGLVRALERRGGGSLVLRTRQELDLLDQAAVHRFFREERPEQVIVAAAKVGGIHANATQPADFIYENLVIETNLIHAAAEHGVQKLLFLGSSCIYPKFAPQPIPESALLTGPLEPTNEAYAIAKIAGLKLCEYYFRQYGKRFVSAMPTNLYGPHDNFHPLNSHVIPGLLRRFHEAKIQGKKEIAVWGSGKPLREFLHVDDLAEGLLHVMDHFNEPGFLNVGSGEEVTIAELARLVAEVIGFTGEIQWDASKPDGTPRKIMDSSKVRALGWAPKISLKEGLKQTYLWAVENGKFA